MSPTNICVDLLSRNCSSGVVHMESEFVVAELAGVGGRLPDVGVAGGVQGAEVAAYYPGAFE